jgi:hypothetical protein
MKVHNTDYLSDESLQWHPRLGIHAANVASGIWRGGTRALVSIMEEKGLKDLADGFLSIAYASGNGRNGLSVIRKQVTGQGHPRRALCFFSP